MATTPAPVKTTADETRIPGSTTSRFVGEQHGSGVSLYISRNAPGQGPSLHTHPYSETFVIHEGSIRFTVGEQVIDAGPGDIVVVPPRTPHGFTNVGDAPMHSVNIHAAPRMEQTDLDSERLEDGSFRLV